jgi:nicotinamidase-related amidase
VIYTTGTARADKWDLGSWHWKDSRTAGETSGGPNAGPDPNQIIPDIAPLSTDLVILKRKPSAFFGTELLGFLNLLRCDSVIVAGTTTSGCVRATVVDAFSFNYRVAVAEDACFDRSEASHAVSLCDMHAKYADVLQTSEIVSFLEKLPAGMYSLPTGRP